MIIKGALRRYERWNPVHPTAGAFWGIGIGIGCGVGWGPGFGPEVIGYVGSGCGAGFSVGFTLLGLGIGLPANYVFTFPYNAFMVTRSGALELAQLNSLYSVRNVAMDGWNNFGPLISDLQRRAGDTFSRFKNKNSLEKGIHSDLQTALLSCTQPTGNQIQKVVARNIPSKGSQD